MPGGGRRRPTPAPPTGRISGHANNPKSHWWYRVGDPPAKASESFRDRGDKLVELRSTGAQTVAPPSVHPTGKPIVWYEPLGPAGQVEIANLRTAVARVAAAALLARHWPGKGNRHGAHLALAGALFRAGWAEADVSAFVSAVAAATADEEIRGRLRDVLSTAQKAAAGDRTTGWPTLERLLVAGEGVVRQVREWLGVPVADDPEPWGKPIPLSESRDVRRFPTDVYPPAVQAFAEAVARSMNCPVDYAAVPILGTAGAAVGGARALEIKPGYTVLPNLYTATVGPPGSAKSPAQKAVTDPLHDIDAELARRSADAGKEYRLKLDDYKEDLKEWRKGTRRGPGLRSPSSRPSYGRSSAT